MASLRGEIGIWAPAARYITLHGGVGELGSTVNALQQDVIGVAQGVSTASAQAVDARDEARLVQAAVTALSGDASRVISDLRGELAAAKSERQALESTVLTLSEALTALMTNVGLGPVGGITQSSLDERFRLHDKAVNGRLDTIRQEMKGGGITVGGVKFSRWEAAMDWARINLPPNTYQCIGGMIYAMCLISEAVVHQEDMMKREEHGERVKRTFMQSAQVLSVHTAYPPVLDGAKAAQRDSKVDSAELKTYKQWKPVNGEGTSKKLKEGVERAFELITNTIDLTFAMRPVARMVLLDSYRSSRSCSTSYSWWRSISSTKKLSTRLVGNTRPTRPEFSAGRWSPSSSARFSRPRTGRGTLLRRRGGPRWIHSRPTDSFSTQRWRNFAC